GMDVVARDDAHVHVAAQAPVVVVAITRVSDAALRIATRVLAVVAAVLSQVLAMVAAVLPQLLAVVAAVLARLAPVVVSRLHRLPVVGALVLAVFAALSCLVVAAVPRRLGRGGRSAGDEQRGEGSGRKQRVADLAIHALTPVR